MTIGAEEILKQALELPPAERLPVAQVLWDSVDSDPDSPVLIDDALIAEIDRRYEELRSGAVTPLTHDELMQSVQGSLERRRAATLEIDEEFAEELRRRDAEMDAGMVMTREEMHAAIQQRPAALQRGRTDIRNWQLWQPGPIEGRVDRISPLLASWEKSSHPAQVRLRAYLDDLADKLLPLPENEPLFLRLDVDVEEPERLLHHYNLENYLTPLFGSRCLPPTQFVLVMARKYVGGGSRIAWGIATHAASNDNDEWSSFTINAGSGATQKSWKERIRAALSDSDPAMVAPGPARVRLAWRCASHRNWCTFWKPTGDAMGPVLGDSNPLKPFHLDDDRIVDLELHRNVDDALGNDVEVGMWWSAMP